MIFVSLAYVLLPTLVGLQVDEHDFQSGMPVVVRKALAEQPHWRFSGTRVVSFKAKTELVEYTEYVTRDGASLRIEYPGGSRYSGQIIVETDGKRRHFDPKRNEIRIGPAHQESLFEHIRGPWRGDHGIRVIDEPGTRIAGYSTRLARVLDRQGNVLQELNIEPHNGVVLARRTYDRVGTLRGSFEFREIKFNPTIESSLFTIRRNGATIVTPETELKRVAEKSGFLPLSLPASTGFELDSVRKREISGNDVLMCQYMSSKGRIFLFQLKVGVDPNTLNRQLPNHIYAVTQMIQGRWFVILGPLAESNLREALSELR